MKDLTDMFPYHECNYYCANGLHAIQTMGPKGCQTIAILQEELDHLVGGTLTVVGYKPTMEHNFDPNGPTWSENDGSPLEVAGIVFVRRR